MISSFWEEWGTLLLSSSDAAEREDDKSAIGKIKRS